MSDETFVQTLAGRDIEFRVAKPGQILILKRMYERARDQLTDTEGRKGAEVFGEMLQRSMDVVESLMVDPANIAFLENEILMGRLEQDELMAVLAGPKKEVAPKKKTAKSTPKAAPRKATAPVASRGRTKR